MVIDRPGKENQVVDFLSRLNTEGENVHVFYEFPDENIFALATHTPWFAEFADYLAIGELP